MKQKFDEETRIKNIWFEHNQISIQLLADYRNRVYRTVYLNVCLKIKEDD